MERLLNEAAVRRAFFDEVERQGADCTQLSPRLLAWMEAKLRVQIKHLVAQNREFQRATITEVQDD